MVLLMAMVAGLSTRISPPVFAPFRVDVTVVVDSPGCSGVMKRDTSNCVPAAFSDKCLGFGPTSADADVPNVAVFNLTTRPVASSAM